MKLELERQLAAASAAVATTSAVPTAVSSYQKTTPLVTSVRDPGRKQEASMVRVRDSRTVGIAHMAVVLPTQSRSVESFLEMVHASSAVHRSPLRPSASDSSDNIFDRLQDLTVIKTNESRPIPPDLAVAKPNVNNNCVTSMTSKEGAVVEKIPVSPVKDSVVRSPVGKSKRSEKMKKSAREAKSEQQFSASPRKRLAHKNMTDFTSKETAKPISKSSDIKMSTNGGAMNSINECAVNQSKPKPAALPKSTSKSVTVKAMAVCPPDQSLRSGLEKNSRVTSRGEDKNTTFRHPGRSGMRGGGLRMASNHLFINKDGARRLHLGSTAQLEEDSSAPPRKRAKSATSSKHHNVPSMSSDLA